MPARSLLRTAFAVLIGACLLSGCKFFNSPSTAEGVYFGYYTPGDGSAPVAIYGAIWPGQYAYFGNADGALYVLPDTIKDQAFTGTVPAYAPLGQTFKDGRTRHSYSLSGQASASNDTVDNIIGTLSGDTGAGSFSLTYKNLSTNTTSLATLAGTYQGYYWGSSTAISLTLSANGGFTYTDGFGCTASGSLSMSSDYNLMQANATVTGNSVCPGTVNGLGFTDTKDLANLFQNASGTYIYLGLSNQTDGVVAELYKS